MHRIAELLQTEYRNFDDTILVESSFAQVNRNGKGIRQVQLGWILITHNVLRLIKLFTCILALTGTKFIVASDVFWQPISKKRSRNRAQPFHISLELNKVVPLDLIKLRVYIRDNKRFILQVEYCTKRVLIFEFAGFTNRHVSTIKHASNIRLTLPVCFQLDFRLWKDCVDAVRIGQHRKVCSDNITHSSGVSSEIDFAIDDRRFQCEVEVHQSYDPIWTSKSGDNCKSFRKDYANNTKNSNLTHNFGRDIEEDKKNVMLDLCRVLALRKRTVADTSILNMKETVQCNTQNNRIK